LLCLSTIAHSVNVIFSASFGEEGGGQPEIGQWSGEAQCVTGHGCSVRFEPTGEAEE
jgi:hypothetical protein